MSAFPHVVEDSCNARVGLMGNPSDGFKGKTLSFLLANFKATVRIEERSKEHGIEIAEPVFFDSLVHLFTHSQKIVSAPPCVCPHGILCPLIDYHFFCVGLY
jgi:hypothetical protein